MKKKSLPTSGGRWIRDRETGKLARPGAAAPKPAPEPPAGPPAEREPPAAPRKKGR